jgi:hypothetical protein
MLLPFLFTYLFLYKLIYEAVNISDNKTLHKKTTKLWIETDVERNGHCLEKLRSNTKNVSKDSRCTGRNSNIPCRYPVSGAAVDRHLVLDLSERNVLFVNKHVLVIKARK